MKKIFLHFFFLGLFLLGFTHLFKALAQDTLSTVHNGEFDPNVAEEAFKIAVKKHKAELKILIDIKTGDTTDVFYKNSRTYSPSDTSVRDIASSIKNYYDEKTGVLFYNYEETTLKIWLLNYQGIKGYYQQEITQAQLEKLINDHRKALRIDLLQQSRSPHLRGILPETDTSKIPDLLAATNQLTSHLIPPVIAHNLRSLKAMIVVPVLALGTVPFAILRPFKTSEYLIESMSICFAPSLFEIRPDTAEKWSAVFTKSLIVGNPDFTERDLHSWDIPPLPGAQKEAEAISILVKASLLTGKNATKDAVLLNVSDADFLYFATHGVSDRKSSRTKSFLILSGTEKQTGFWTMEEILNRRYRAKLAVLSACQTGLGETYKGGIMALGRTFQVAGVPRVVMSLWNVDDNATVYLMEAFVRNLQKNPPSESLRQAMLTTREKYTDPSKWASFVLFGTPK